MLPANLAASPRDRTLHTQPASREGTCMQKGPGFVRAPHASARPTPPRPPVVDRPPAPSYFQVLFASQRDPIAAKWKTALHWGQSEKPIYSNLYAFHSSSSQRSKLQMCASDLERDKTEVKRLNSSVSHSNTRPTVDLETYLGSKYRIKFSKLFNLLYSGQQNK